MKNSYLIAVLVVLVLSGCLEGPLGSAFEPAQRQSQSDVPTIPANGGSGTTYDLELTIATLKDEYQQGEDVDLTDPPTETDSSSIQGNAQNANENQTTREPTSASLQETTRELSEVKLFDRASIEARMNYILRNGTPKTIRGKLVTIHHDDFENQRSENQYFIHQDGRKYKIYFPMGCASLISH